MDHRNKTKQSGFTLMEIIVASTIFAVVSVSMLSLFNYVLKINRRTEALRQASQGMRNFVEFLVKEVRNGQIDYYVSGGGLDAALGPCQAPGVLGSNTYSAQDNKLGIINTDNVKECFYFGDDTSPIPVYAGANVFTQPAGHKYSLVMQKSGIASPQVLTPPNLRVEKLMFLVRPICDPYTHGAGAPCAVGQYPQVQPIVTILIKFVAQLPTGEQVPIYYQTSVSENKYDIPQ